MKIINKIKRFLNYINTIPCSCGSRNFRHKVTDLIEYIIIEEDIICENCGNIVNTWNAGHCLKPETYTEMIPYWLHGVRY